MFVDALGSKKVFQYVYHIKKVFQYVYHMRLWMTVSIVTDNIVYAVSV